MRIGLNIASWLLAMGCSTLKQPMAPVPTSTHGAAEQEHGTLESAPSAVLTARYATAVSVGDGHTCALLRGGRVECWGQGSNGNLGNGDTTTHSVTPVAVAGITDATAIAAGFGNTCALLKGGTVQCWGSNTDRVFGRTAFSLAVVPIPIRGITNATAIVHGGNHFCALLASGTVKCWGHNGVGQLGDGTKDRGPASLAVPEPVFVKGIANAVALAAGQAHTCALLANGTVECWGFNLSGELGHATLRSSAIPVLVEGLAQVTTIAAGNAYSCATLTDGTVRCWGTFPKGNRRMPSSAAPTTISGIDNAQSVAAGPGHACALIRGGRVKCWGDNEWGQLGNGTVLGSATPVDVSGIDNATAISLGDFSSCAALTDGSLRCWGQNVSGQLGDGTTRNSSVPVAVLDLTRRPAHCGGSWPNPFSDRLPAGEVRRWFEVQGLTAPEPLPTCFRKLAWPNPQSEVLLCSKPHFSGRHATLLVKALGVRQGEFGFWLYEPIGVGTATAESCGQYRAIDRLLVQLELVVDSENQTFVIRDRVGSSCEDTLNQLTLELQRGMISIETHTDWKSQIRDTCTARRTYQWRDSGFVSEHRSVEAR